MAAEGNAWTRWRSLTPGTKWRLGAIITGLVLIIVSQVWSLFAPSQTADKLAHIGGILLPLLLTIVVIDAVRKPGQGVGEQ